MILSRITCYVFTYMNYNIGPFRFNQTFLHITLKKLYISIIVYNSTNFFPEKTSDIKRYDYKIKIQIYKLQEAKMFKKESSKEVNDLKFLLSFIDLRV